MIMQYLVSFALLVFVAGWIVGVYNRLEHLRRVVCNSWQQWRKITHRRNLCLRDFATEFAAFLPADNPMAQNLLRLAVDSERGVTLALEPRWNSQPGFIGGAELLLRQVVADSVLAIETAYVINGHEQLLSLTQRVAALMGEQEQITALFNRAALEYNTALVTPAARLLAPLLGFCTAAPLDAPGMQNTTPAASEGKLRV